MKLDAGELTINSGVALSYLDGPSQSSVAAALEQYGKKLTDAQAAELRTQAGSGTLTVPAVLDVLTRSKDSGLKSIHIKPAVYAPYFASDTPRKEIEQVICKALSLYFSRREESA